ncbi:hypothetical protein GCM10010156_51640 [Planobispora rosea]|uniref:Uncharacterized protein n=1 Tax=Planobispora rosea TaxID=35762 RepID=A0A8J3SEL8_PLARO|nr:hypothetical protein [Planobispora rosea]GGS86763.1 hypothetical protein GCM10010156_51640 [Planobispora rosea]GIH88318.1 hypothetical protein Pro02_67260 [Planobispora rosea]
MYPATPPPSAHVHENAAWARYLLAISSPRAAQVIRERALERRRRVRHRDPGPDHWRRTDILAQTALDLNRPQTDDWAPPADEEEVDERTLALARARTRARLERAARSTPGPHGGGPPRT